MVLVVEPTGALRDGRIQTVEVVRRTNRENAVHRLEPFDLVQEVATALVDYQAVQVLEDKEARRHGGCVADMV